MGTGQSGHPASKQAFLPRKPFRAVVPHSAEDGMRMPAHDSGKEDSMRHDSARRKPGRGHSDDDPANQSSGAVPSPRETEWLLDGLAIRPPLEEFRRIFEVKKTKFIFFSLMRLKVLCPSQKCTI